MHAISSKEIISLVNNEHFEIGKLAHGYILRKGIYYVYENIYSSIKTVFFKRLVN